MAFRYLKHADNYAFLYTVTASESHAEYPIANIKTEVFAEVWRSNGGLTNVDWYVDLGASRNWDFLGVGNHNFTSGVTVALAAGTTTGYSDFSASATYRAGSLYYFAPSTQNYRHIRFRVTDAANPLGFLEAGYLMVGLKSTPAKAVNLSNAIHIDHIARNQRVDSEFASPSIDHLLELKRLTLSFNNIPSADRASMITWASGLKAEVEPLFIIPEDSIYDGWYMRLEGGPREKRMLYTDLQNLTWLEDGSGKRIAA